MENKIKKKIIIGTWPLSGDYGVIKPSQVEKILLKCYKNGFKELDTAPSYGNGNIENLIGSIFNGVNDVKINTKIGNIPFIGKSFKLDDLKRSFDNSLKRLKTEKINILFLHNPRDELKNNQKTTIKFLDSLKSQKIIKFTGLSCAPNYNYDINLINFFDYLQDDFNLLKKSSLQKKNIYARSIFANGILTGAIDNNHKFNHYDHRSLWLNDKYRRGSLKNRLKILRKNFGRDLRQHSFNFVLSNRNVFKAIFGIKKISHINSLTLMIRKFKRQVAINRQIEYLIKNDFFMKQSDKKLGF